MKKKTLLLLLSIFLLIFFHQTLYALFDKYFVNKFLADLQGDWLYWPICALYIATLVQLLAMLRDRAKVLDVIFLASILLLCCYFYQRFFSTHYRFYFSTFTPEVSYTDYFLLPLVATVILGTLDRLRKHTLPKMGDQPFLVDSPIEKSLADDFSRNAFARLMAEKIQSSPAVGYSGALAIGILGNWGSGKTSFLNLIKEKIDEHGRIIIDFNPWRSSSPAMIIENFFELLTAELSKFDSSLSREMSKYADSLTELEDGWISKSIKSGVSFFTGPASVGVDYEEINEALGRINKQIIVFIDDLDRLDSKEIMEVLRIIRNTGNFRNLVYVVAYDRGYVTMSLASLNSHQSQQYLEKIFQFEFKLPEAAALILRRNIRHLLKQSASLTAFHSVLDAAIDYTGRAGECFTDVMIRTQREVVRLCNAFLFEISDRIPEVNLIDFYLLQLLKIRYPKIYEGVVRYKNQLFFQEQQKMRLRLVSEIGEREDTFEFLGLSKKTDQQAAAPESQRVLEVYLDSFDKEIIDDFGKRTVVDLFAALLTEKDLRDESVSSDYKGFVNAFNFERYFMSDQGAVDLSFAEFESARASDYPQYLQQVMQWVQDPDKLAELERRLDIVEDFVDKKEWENHLKILIELERIKMQNRGAYGLKYAQLVDVLRYPVKHGKTRLFNDQADYLNYVRDLFKNAADPYVFEAHLLMAVLVSEDSIGLTGQEMQDQLFAYLQQYTSAHPELSSDFRQLHPAVVEKSKLQYGQFPIQERADKLFKAHFKKYLTACDLGGFIKIHFDPDHKYYMFDIKWIEEIFDSKETFLAYTKTAENIDKESPCYQEFLAYSEKVASSAYPAILFDFKHLIKENPE